MTALVFLMKLVVSLFIVAVAFGVYEQLRRP